MRSTLAAADADAALREVTLPAAWDDVAASGLASLAPGQGAVMLASLAESWLGRLAERGHLTLAAEAHELLLAQLAAPGPEAWAGGTPAGFRLNLAALAPGDTARLLDVADVALAATTALWPGEPVRLQLTGAAGLIAAAGLDYDSPAARDLLADVLRALRGRRSGLTLGVVEADAIDALLGVETAGIAPAFGVLGQSGALSRTSRSSLAARGISPAAALAAVLGGQDVLPVATRAAHAVMDAALASLLEIRPALPPALPVPAGPNTLRRDLPARRGGIAVKAVVGGQKVFLRTGEYPDGRPGEVAITLPQASPAVRALVECLSHAIGIGLQHGAPLAEFVDALAGTRFAPAGAVEGDPAVPRATSAIDYVMRHLAHTYLPALALPPTETDTDEAPPLLPLELPQEPPRRRGLRVVK